MNAICLKKLHETEVEILNNIVCICKKHDLKYYLVGGTLLGAVRHKGFIPWDDDLDIAMPRNDYNKFLEVAQEELGEQYFLQTGKTDKNCCRLFSKVRKNKTLFVEYKDQHIDKHHGIFVDIFPLDSGGRYTNRKTQSPKMLLYRLFRSYLQDTRGEGNQKFSTKYFFKKVIYALLWIIPDNTIIDICDWLSSGRGDFYINYCSQYGIKKQTIEKRMYDPAVQLEFEGNMYDVPREYDYILKRIYGDNYMQLPPEEKRVTHNPVRINFDTDGPDENAGD